MKYVPHEYQKRGIKFLLGQPHAGLLADMGLGKTSMTLAAVKTLYELGMIKKVLLIAPIRTLYTVWPTEIKKWDNFNSITYLNCHYDRARLKQKALIHGINPESALGIMGKGKFDVDYDLLIIDESSMFKNPASRRFKMIQKILHTFPRRWILTGTPAPNGMVDIWSQIYLLDRGDALGKFITHFRNLYCTLDHSGFTYSVPTFLKSKIYEAIAPLCLRMEATDHLDMPELVSNEIEVTLPKEAMTLYREMERELLIILQEEAIYSPNAAVAGMRCRQIANGGIYMEDRSVTDIHDAKADALKELVEQLQGKPLLVFYEFRHDIDRIRKALGDVPNLAEAKDPMGLVNRFNEGKIPVMMGHPASIGMGLNLQGSCHNICWVGPPWDLGLYDQANARVYRQGQESTRVIIHHIVAQKTLDGKVLKALAGKRKVQDELLGAVKELNNQAK